MLLAAALAVAVGPAAGQEPDTVPDTLPDTVPRQEVADSLRDLRAGQDTVPVDTAVADTLGPPPSRLPRLEAVGPVGWSHGVWEWDRDALLRRPDLSLLQLLEQIPGIAPVRPDMVNRAESGAVFGATAAAIRYIVDGFELDALTAPTFDPSRMPLLALDRVRVERRVTGATVRIETLSPDHPRPRSVVEAGTGDYDINLFRGIFLAPRLVGGPLGVGFERLASDGGPGAGESAHTAAWLKWTWVRDSTGLQVEYRQSDMERSGVGEAVTGARRDWVVRARTGRGSLLGEVYAGASSVEDERGTDVLREGTPQGGVRLRGSWGGPVPLELRTAARFRDHPRLPAAELDLAVRAAPFPGVALEAEAVEGFWSEGSGTGRWSVGAHVRPLPGLSLFGQVVRGSALAGGGPEVRRPSPDGPPLDGLPLAVTRDGVRAGAELNLGGLMLGGALLRTSADTVPGFGLPFEPPGLGGAGAEVTGVEAVARVPTPWDPLRLEGWYVGADTPQGWLYLPQHQWRAALVYHHLPLPSGNLELYARVERVYRGPMTVAAGVDPEAAPLPPERAVVPELQATNLELTIRILTLRAFLRWENMLHRLEQRDLYGPPLDGGEPAYVMPGQRILFGGKWKFVN